MNDNWKGQTNVALPTQWPHTQMEWPAGLFTPDNFFSSFYPSISNTVNTATKFDTPKCNGFTVQGMRL
jgi:hypothetical protein